MTNKNKVEAALFASGKAMEVDYIAKLTKLSKDQVKKALDQLKKEYEKRETSLKIFQEGKKWKVNVTDNYLEIVKSLVAETELERPTLETLAVIAYKSPILQSSVVKSRGTNAYEHIKELLKREFITRERHGRSFKIRIANKFFEYFDVQGDKEIRELFKNIKKPAQKQMFDGLQVIDIKPEKKEEPKDEQKELLGSLEIIKTKEDKRKEGEFLSEFDEKITQVKEKNDETEKEFEKFKPKEEEPPEEEEKEPEETEEGSLEELDKKIDELVEEHEEDKAQDK
jgi:segregation and condensation protein B